MLSFAPLFFAAVVGSPPADFTNPVLPNGADPWVVKHADRYHYCTSRRGGIWVTSSPSLIGALRARPRLAWRPEPGQPWSQSLWAPELHRIGDAWYIYVAADDGKNENHRMQVLRRTDPDPAGPFEHVGPLELPDNKWAIDGTALQIGEQLYHVWSGWPGDTNGTQLLYICRMKDPVTPAGERVVISSPTLDWETVGNPTVNEGPQIIQHDGRTFIVYSASGSWTDNYCLGLLELVGEDPMDPAAWKKHEQPVFQGANDVISPGHASFTTSPDDTEHWIIYHAAKHPGAGWNRDVRMQPFTFNADGLPDFGQPVPAGQPLPLPSRNRARATE